MVYIDRVGEPEFWKRFVKKHPGIHYDELQNTEEGIKTRIDIRTYNIEQQHGLCAYCCRAITPENSLNEHIKPRGRAEFAKLSMDYDNIVASCASVGVEATCSAAKRSQYSELFISPLDRNCENYFEYYPNGTVVSDYEEGKYTINVLKLNSFKICRARRAYLKSCDDYNDPGMVKALFIEPDSNNRLIPFVDIVRYFYGRD